MKKNLGVLICFVVSLLISCQKEQATVRIPLDGRNDYSPLVREVLGQNSKGRRVIEFEEGVYHFYPEKAKGMFVRVSNNDNGYKRIAFYIDGMENIEIRGNNTEFMFHGSIVPLYINNSSAVSISGISIDYDTSFMLEGKVLTNNDKDKSIDIKLRDDIRYEIKDGRLFYSGYDWSQPLGQNIVFDPQTGAPYYYTSKYLRHYERDELRAKDLGNQTVRLSGFESLVLPPVGSIYIDKGPYRSNRMFPGIIVHSSSSVSISDVNIYMAGGMALIAENTEDITMDKFNVRLREGSGRYISASADATHFVNCRGTVSFNECVFENMLDDATNVHGTYMLVDEFLSEDSICVRFGHLQQEGFLFASAGDSLQLIDRQSLLPVDKFVVGDVDIINDKYWIIRSRTPLSSKTIQSAPLAIENLTNTASVVMRSCSVKNNRARSILISTPKPVLIENNYFDSMMAGVIIAGDANSWFESGNVSDVIIRNNTFVNMGKGGEAPQSVLQISPEIPPPSRAKGYYHGRILFQDNLVKTFDSQVIYALSVDNLEVSGNTFIQTYDYRPIFEGLSYIDAQHCNNVLIEGNTFEGGQEAEVSTAKCKSVIVGEQRGFKKGIVNNPNTFFYRQ